MTESVSLAMTATIVLLAALSGATTLVGIALALWVPMRPSVVGIGIGFSLGIMLVLSLFELLPEAVSRGGLMDAFGGAVLGAGAIGLVRLVVERAGIGGSPAGRAGVALRTAYVVAAGLILHDVPEGFAMANAYLAAPSSGLVMAVAIAIHNVPEEFALALPAAIAGSRPFLYAAGLASALAEPVGAVLGLAGVGVWPALHAAFLAFAGGAMTFVAVAELGPLARRLAPVRLVGVGAALSIAVYAPLAAVLKG